MVGRSVGRSVGLSVGRSVRQSGQAVGRSVVGRSVDVRSTFDDINILGEKLRCPVPDADSERV